MERRLELGAVMSEIEACFNGRQATKASRRFSTEAALRLVQRVFGADQCALALVDPSISRISECFVANPRMSVVWRAMLIDEVVSLVHAGQPVFRVVPALEVVRTAVGTSGSCKLLVAGSPISRSRFVSLSLKETAQYHPQTSSGFWPTLLCV
ncbi:hypothetical protein AJ88_47000 [Mesorhizobium amorphae CCBAU 01583]|nr:hypothetical protein AJ88_47000 [Mesorhizobium amorphae CCBAU 01583]